MLVEASLTFTSSAEILRLVARVEAKSRERLPIIEQVEQREHAVSFGGALLGD